MNYKRILIPSLALLSALTFSGCAQSMDHPTAPEDGAGEIVGGYETEESGSGGDGGEETGAGSVGDAGSDGGTASQEPSQTPAKQTVSYIKVTGDGVNIRKGAGTSYASVGAAEKNTLYAYLGEVNGWYKTYYKNAEVYLAKSYCTLVEMEKSTSDLVERVIAEGTRYMGVTYVYGATRYHDGTGKLLSGFTNTKFDCSSLMQYIFKIGAGINLQVNTRTQVAQGTTVSRANIRRGDLIFFTNSSRKNLTGIERIGHVALYLGDNLILHTSSDYAKIEEISSTRWSYYIQTQRML